MTRFSLPLFTAVGIAAMTALASPAAAIEYPWCAQYNGEEGGGRNCGFSTIEQCMTTVRGIGGILRTKSVLYRPRRAARQANA